MRQLSGSEIKQIIGGDYCGDKPDCGGKIDLDCGTKVCIKLVSSGDCGVLGLSCSNIHQCVPI